MSSSSSSETILPIIVPSFDDSSARVIQTNEPSTIVEAEQTTDPSSQTATATGVNNSEFTNPRGIRFTTAPTTPASTGPVKGREKTYQSFVN